jgi:MFS transporter, DHA1 family, tetracycline resistance protein
VSVSTAGSQPATRSPLPRGFWVIWTTVALDLVGFGIVAPLLGVYAKRFGASPTTIGFLFASFSLAQFVFAPILGRLSDRIGRKPVILISLFGTAIGSVITGAAGSIWILFLGRVIDGASGASVSVAQGAVADVVPGRDHARAFGLLGAAFGVGFVVGPALGALSALQGPHLPFYVAGAIAFINGLVAIVRLPETNQHKGVMRPANSSVHSRQLWRLVAVTFTAVAAFSGFEATFALLAQDRFDLTDVGIASVFICIGVFLVVVQVGLIRPLGAKLGVQRSVSTGLASTAIGMLFLAFATSWFALVPALIMLSFGQGLTSPNFTAMVSGGVPAQQRGEALGFQQSGSALARVAGPSLAGVLFHRVGIPAPYLVAAALCCAAIAGLNWNLDS